MKKIARTRPGRMPLSPQSMADVDVSGGSPTLPLPPPRLERIDPDPNPWQPVFEPSPNPWLPVGIPTIGY